MKTFLSLLVNGITLSGIYALLAVSFTLVYGVMRLINFAYAGLFTVAAYFGIWLLGGAGVTGEGQLGVLAAAGAIALALVLGMLVVGLLGVVVDQTTYRPLRFAPILSPLITSLAVVFILSNGILAVVGPSPRYFPVHLGRQGFGIGGVNVSPADMVIVGVALGLVLALRLLVHRSGFGISMRATADDPVAARLAGVRTERIIAGVFGIGSALGAAAAIMYTLYYGTATYNMGYIPTLKAFAAAVLGGIGSIEGAAVGALVLGLVESFFAGYGSIWTDGAIGSNYEDAVAFIVLIAIITLRPTGIMGDRAALD
jgi:branched-chain amino acid transport system permease protein